MALPTSRNTTYTPATPVKSNDLNEIQDCIVSGKHKSRRFWFSPIYQNGSGAVPNLNNGEIVATGLMSFSHPIQGLFVGQRITGFAVKAQGINTGAADFHVDLLKNHGDGSGDFVDIGANIFNDTAVGALLFERTLAAPHVVVAEYTYYFGITIDAAGQVISGLAIDVDLL